MFRLTFCFLGFHQFEYKEWKLHKKGFTSVGVFQCTGCKKVVLHEIHKDGSIGDECSDKYQFDDESEEK
jgi:hypothetical protein